MGQKKDERFQRAISCLRWMMGVNMVLLILVIVLGVTAAVLKHQVNQLTDRLGEVDLPVNAGESGSGESNDSVIGEADETGDSAGESSSEVYDVSGESGSDESAEQTQAELRNYIVCLDAGHGGPQGKGAISTLDGRIESHDTLKITLAVQKALEAYEDVTVVMTRTEDVEVDNGVRAEIANEANADLFVSFHRNSNTSGNKSGVEGWIHSSNPEDSRAAGELILAAMEAVGVAENFGVKSGTWDEPDVNYKIIRLAEMPAVLLEVGYLNSAVDNQLFDQNYEAYAAATAEAIYTWLVEWAER